MLKNTVRYEVVNGLVAIQKDYLNILNTRCDDTVNISEAGHIANDLHKQYNSLTRLINHLDPSDTLAELK